MDSLSKEEVLNKLVQLLEHCQEASPVLPMVRGLRDGDIVHVTAFAAARSLLKVSTPDGLIKAAEAMMDMPAGSALSKLAEGDRQLLMKYLARFLELLEKK